ncbi:hypothetical protein [Mitsuaria sp. GD03876]|uniref:hypothetical protein n=1 Tax=Mitsuaria sp. GD03876 TaxID=2975399 RepID=UPI002447CE53|nr:hypothetical protein [Mitsuaria sp. GD03876]MDH0865968.1 CCDC90 family protein [Mitsuaria sp. GD03876]
MKLALHQAFRQVGASDHEAHIAAESIDGALEKRMTDRQGQYARLTDLQALKVDMADLKSQVASVRGEVTILRAEMKQEIAGVRSEMKQEIASVRGDMALLRGEVKQELANTKTDLVRWMVGSQAATITVLASLIFGLFKYLKP